MVKGCFPWVDIEGDSEGPFFKGMGPFGANPI